MSFSKDTNGYSIIPWTNGRAIYVDASQTDNSGDGLSHATAKRDIADGVALMRTGFPDYVLLKMGQTWTEAVELGSTSGFSAAEPCLLGSYDPAFPNEVNPSGSVLARPLVRVTPALGSGISTESDYFAMVGVHVKAYTRDPNDAGYNSSTVDTGIEGFRHVSNPYNFLFLEDNQFEFFCFNLDIAGGTGSSGLTVRRNIINNSYAQFNGTNNQGSGLYFTLTDGALIEENIIDHNGWNETVTDAGPRGLNHNIYCQHNNTNPTIRRNVVARDASGSQFRAGGLVYNNSFFGSPYAHDFGLPVAGLHTCSSNVYTEALQLSDPDGTVIQHGLGPATMEADFFGVPENVGTALFDRLLVANAINSGEGITVEAGFDNKVTISNSVIFNWSTTINDLSLGTTKINNIEDAAGSNPGIFTDATRTSATYAAAIGVGSTQADLLTAMRSQSRQTYDPRLTAWAFNDYMRTGFNMATLGSGSGLLLALRLRLHA